MKPGCQLTGAVIDFHRPVGELGRHRPPACLIPAPELTTTESTWLTAWPDIRVDTALSTWSIAVRPMFDEM